jgi:hypothetical protein
VAAGGGSGPGTPTPVPAPMILLTREKGNSAGSPKGSKDLIQAPIQASATATAPAGVDPGGRAGRWGPVKKVVKENERPMGWKK